MLKPMHRWHLCWGRVPLLLLSLVASGARGVARRHWSAEVQSWAAQPLPPKGDRGSGGQIGEASQPSPDYRQPAPWFLGTHLHAREQAWAACLPLPACKGHRAGAAREEVLLS